MLTDKKVVDDKQIGKLKITRDIEIEVKSIRYFFKLCPKVALHLEGTTEITWKWLIFCLKEYKKKLVYIKQEIMMSRAFDFDTEFVFRLRMHHKGSVLKKGILKKFASHLDNCQEMKFDWCLAKPFNLHPVAGHENLKLMTFKIREELNGKN